MKKLSLSLFMVFGVLTLASNLYAQTSSTETDVKKSCQQPCTRTAKTDATAAYFPLLTAAPAEQKIESTTTATPEKVNCQVVCTKAGSAKVNCDPKDCPPGCIPANCKIKSCTPASGSTSTAVVSQNARN